MSFDPRTVRKGVLWSAPGFSARKQAASRRAGWKRFSLRLPADMLARIDACRKLDAPILHRTDRTSVIYWALYKGLPKIEALWGPEARAERKGGVHG